MEVTNTSTTQKHQRKILQSFGQLYWWINDSKRTSWLHDAMGRITRGIRKKYHSSCSRTWKNIKFWIKNYLPSWSLCCTCHGRVTWIQKQNIYLKSIIWCSLVLFVSWIFFYLFLIKVLGKYKNLLKSINFKSMNSELNKCLFN